MGGRKLLVWKRKAFIDCGLFLWRTLQAWIYAVKGKTAAAAAAAKSLQSCLTLCDPIDSSPPGSPIPGILQARTLEWVAISFSDPSPTVQEIKMKLNKWDLIKLKSFCTAKETISKMKRQPNQKVWKRLKQTFLQRRHTDGQQTHENMLNITHYSVQFSLVAQSCPTLQPHKSQHTRPKIQIKTTMRYHLTPVRMALIKKSINNKSCRRCGENWMLLHCWWECKLMQPLWKMVWGFLKKLGIKPPYDSAIPLLRHLPWGNQNWKRHMYPIVRCSKIYNS